MQLWALLAAAVIGWTLSLLAYPAMARERGWPQARLRFARPATGVVVCGLLLLVIAFWLVTRLGWPYWIGVPLLGSLFGMLWTEVLRSSSQIAIGLAPAGTIALFLLGG